MNEQFFERLLRGYSLSELKVDEGQKPKRSRKLLLARWEQAAIELLGLKNVRQRLFGNASSQRAKAKLKQCRRPLSE